MSYRILFIGEIVGKFGVYAARKGIKKLQKEQKIDFVVANANGATGGFGLGKNHAITLKNSGIDVLTGGDFTFFKKDLVDFLPKSSFVLRPANYTPKTPGRGWNICKAGDKRIGVINLLGPSGITRNHPSNPFTYVESLVEKIKDSCDIILINFHSKTTAEKQLMFHIINGKVQILVGSGSKSITADAMVSSRKTAYITDTGRTGSSQAPGGLDGSVEIEKLITGIPKRSKDINKKLELQGVIITLDDDNNPESMDMVRIPIKKEENE
jgi:2',3'-cyclic-nucleotide 2'-phosphodiesterase